MKKQLFLLSTLAVTSLASMTSCGSKGNKPYEPGTPLKIGLICVHNDGTTYDKNFMDAFKTSCEKAKKAGMVKDYAIKTDVPEEGRDCYNAAEEFVNQGFNIVCSDSFGHDVSMHEAAKEFENVQFTSATGIEARKSGLKNFHNAFASIYEGRYLAGVAAGHFLSEHYQNPTDQKVGYVGAYPYAEVISGLTSWFLGVKSVVSDATMAVSFTNDWYSPEKEKTAAVNLIRKNCKVISQHADSMGAPSACLEESKGTTLIPNVSYNVDISSKEGGGDEYKKIALAYSKIDWTPYYDNLIKSVFEGKEIEGEKEQNWTGTIATNSIIYNFSKDTALVSETAKADIKSKEAQLKSGALHVFDTSKFTVKNLDSENIKKWYEKNNLTPPEKGKDYTFDETTGCLLTMKGAADMYARDTELIKKDPSSGTSYVQESTFRSAPSFDFIIDGIELV